MFRTERVVDNLSLRTNIRKCHSSRSVVLLGRPDPGCARDGLLQILWTNILTDENAYADEFLACN